VSASELRVGLAAAEQVAEEVRDEVISRAAALEVFGVALSGDADPTALAKLASATLHTIALRARAGTPRAELEQLARQAVGVICGR